MLFARVAALSDPGYFKTDMSPGRWVVHARVPFLEIIAVSFSGPVLGCCSDRVNKGPRDNLVFDTGYIERQEF